VLTRASDGVLEFEASESAYHMVVAVDVQGEMHLLFPRYWIDDGWVRRGSVQRLHSVDFATCGDPWQGQGIVTVEVIASPTPFAWERLGLRRTASGCRWEIGGRVYRVSDDPYVAFNRLHRRLFPRWDHALFVVDDTWFFVGAACDVAPWVRSRRPVRVRRASGWSAAIHVRWDWEFGAWCARPVYRTAAPRPRVPALHERARAIVRRSKRSVPVRQTSRVVVDPRVERKQVVQRVRRSAPQAERRVTHRKRDVQRTRQEPVERRRLR
jgi:hypothetical protein